MSRLGDMPLSHVCGSLCLSRIEHEKSPLFTFAITGRKEMTTPDNNDPTSNNSRESEYEDTVILLRCAKHGIAYMANEKCSECEKEKGSSDGEGAGINQ